MKRARILPALGAILALAAAVAAGPAPRAAEQPASPVKVVLELSQRFYYAGDPFHVRLTIGNDGGSPVDNPVRSSLFQGFQVRTADGRRLEPQGRPSVPEPPRPEKLTPKGFYGAIVDLTEIYPQLRQPGRYEIQWAADGLESDVVSVAMLPRYDPSKDYRARMITDAGVVVLQLFKDTAPIAVKNFVDLANAGFYDGTAFHEVAPDQYVVGGDPTGTGAGGPGYSYPAELAPVPVVAGSVVLKPVSPAPPANGSQFIITVRPQPDWVGQLTVLGQVLEGLDVVQKISKEPGTALPGRSRPAVRPSRAVRIQKIVIEAVEPAAGASGPSSPGSPAGSGSAESPEEPESGSAK